MEEKNNIEIIAFPRSNFGERDVEIFRELGYTVSTCSIPIFFFSPLKAFRYLFRPRQWIKWYKKLKNTKLFFAWWAVSLDVVLLSKITRKPCIIVAGGGEIETSKDIPKEYKFAYANSSIFKKWVTKLTLKFADKVISDSNYAKKNADKIAKNRTNEVVYLQIDINKFKQKNIEKKNYILTIGYQKEDAIRRKGFLELVEAFSKITHKYPDYKLVFLGDDKGGRATIERKVKALGLKNKVIFKDFKFQNDEELTDFINSCNIYIQYSWQEMFGVAMCEAMACGVPVIASNKAALPEVVGNAGLIADRWNINDLVEKIEMLINDKNLYNKLSKKGIERVKNLFSKEIRKEKLKKIVEELIFKRTR